MKKRNHTNRAPPHSLFSTEQKTKKLYEIASKDENKIKGERS